LQKATYINALPRIPSGIMPTNLLETDSDIQTVQDLLGHTDIRTTEIYTHVVGKRRGGTASPIDKLGL